MDEIKNQKTEEREERYARMRRLAAEAMADPRFVADMRETMHAFRHVDSEGWPSYEEDDTDSSGVFGPSGIL